VRPSMSCSRWSPRASTSSSMGPSTAFIHEFDMRRFVAGHKDGPLCRVAESCVHVSAGGHRSVRTHVATVGRSAVLLSARNGSDVFGASPHLVDSKAGVTAPVPVYGLGGGCGAHHGMSVPSQENAGRWGRLRQQCEPDGARRRFGWVAAGRCGAGIEVRGPWSGRERVDLDAVAHTLRISLLEVIHNA
jgi:hypothetical protein